MSADKSVPIGFEDEVHVEDNAQSDKPESAYDPETGEINWDCPCLDGMAHGTCGEEFKAAFSCFIYSKEEEKGIDCVDKFKAMQDCFKAHPEEYGPQDIVDDDEYLAEQPEQQEQEQEQQQEKEQ
ncbi:Mitochondrial intermembrane space import and assembly protein 40 [Smittium culicis]|uniref:Mitochondrial intermembrane space import and assembly protein 40 n=1 Tax=Smittium culicis TaxID=133412 RepID=A0A1R1XPB6_9FUNG|nr:Mitochondrial intermembrane space import and assembly protein 40 [Smittium culicis]OMJ12687.1 Mitochondrial intermembrane space import and assembly protein 40 [Smittium culicis]OMJ16469.1 Mitochondrial intermembrane space import and assembly protein 40 [Smittium culicis]